MSRVAFAASSSTRALPFALPFARAFAFACALAACSSDPTPAGGGAVTSDGGATDGSAESLPSCVTAGFQCQPKGCNASFEPLNGYGCGNAGGSCCGKSVPKLDAAPSDAAPTDAAPADAADD
jgi:hypothetical protein